MSIEAVPVGAAPQMPPGLMESLLEDFARGKIPNHVHAFITRGDSGKFGKPGTVEDLGISTNLRTNAGIDWQAESMGKTASRPAVADWIALTTNTGAPAAGDTTLTSEITTNGLARAQGTFSHTASATSYKISFTFTATGTHTAVHKGGLFNASSAGTLAFETNLSSDATLASGDTLTIEWTINI